jgi:molybdate transport system substrate-binding protein
MRPLLWLGILGWLATSASAGTIRVAAAISMKDALADVARDFQAATGDTVVFALGSSGQLMSQIRNGADVDVFISAAARQMDELQADGLIDPNTRRDVASNQLVLVVPADAPVGPAGGDRPVSFAELPGVRRLAVGEPNTVPAGAYAAQVLKSLDLESSLAGKLVYGTNVRQVLSYVERGEASAGLVYATDARLSGEKVRIVAAAPAGSHEPIRYPAAVVRRSKQAGLAGRFVAYLTAPAARARFVERGFGEAPPARGAGDVPASQPAGDR